jgi:cob(I)alamin adenosyltransferase
MQVNLKDIPESNLIDYIKSRYPKVVFNAFNFKDNNIKTRALGFVISDNKLILGYIDKNGDLCKLLEPVDLSKLSNSKFIEIIKRIPIVNGFSEENKQSLIDLLEDKNGKISQTENDIVVLELKKQLTEQASKYDVLLDTSKESDKNKDENVLLIKKEYNNTIEEIKDNFKKEIDELKEKVRISDQMKDECKTRLINEKEVIIAGIKNFQEQVKNYIIELVNKHKINVIGESNKLNEMYTKLLNEKTQIENNMNILVEREKDYLQKINNNKSEISEFTDKLNEKEDTINKLMETIKEIQKQLAETKEQFSKDELEKVILQDHKKKCLEKILYEKQEIIDNIKEYTTQWMKWANNNKINVEQQKELFKTELAIIYKNLKKVFDEKNNYIKTLEISSKEKDKLISKLNSNISEIKSNIESSLNQQLLQLSAKNEELQMKLVKVQSQLSESENKLVIKEKDINKLKIELDETRKLLEKNNTTVIPKGVDYDNCYAILQKFMSVNNMFYRKKEIIKILDNIINGTSINSFTNLNENVKNNIIKRYTEIKSEILKHIAFLDLNKYMDSPNIPLFKNKNTVKNVPPAFCDQLNVISEYWDANVGIFREQDRQLTNIYEDLSGAVRVYIKIKPLIGIEQKNNTVFIEGKSKRVTVDCSDVPNVNKKDTFGDFYGIFDESFSNRDVYTGIQSSGDPGNTKVDVENITESTDTVHPGLYSTFAQVEDGYSIVLFGYGLSGSGKCLGRNTPILMYDGTIKMVQDVVDGDLVMGDDSRARRVFGVTRGRDTMYKIKNIKGESYIVNSEHILSLKYVGKKQFQDRESRHSYKVAWFDKEKIGFGSRTFSYKNKNKDEVYIEAQEFYNNIQDDLYIDIPVQKYLSLSNHFKEFLVGYKVPVEFPHRDVEMDPYMIGFWLGDGTAISPEITTQDSTVLKYFTENLAQYKCYLQYHNNESNKYGYRINGQGVNKPNYFLNILRKYNLLDNKHIPHSYKCNSREQRLQLLAGILDADGSYDKDKRMFEFSQGLIHETLFDDVVYLCRSLGFACYKNKKQTSWTYKGVKKEGEAWRICISGEGIENIPTKIKRKQALPRRQIKDVLVSGITVEELPEDDYYGFAVDGNHRFLLGNFTVTHNTYSLLGQDNTPGLLHFGLANLKGVQQIKLKYLFEQYIGKGKVGFNPAFHKITGNIINLINEVPQLRKYSINEINEFADNTPVGINFNKLKVSDINTITFYLEKYRKERGRVKKTPNNPVSSRSHLFMVYEITFESGKVGYITVVDTAGRESPLDIYNMFIDNSSKNASLTSIFSLDTGKGIVGQYLNKKYADYVPQDVYDILREGFYINETINHLIYFFNKKNYKKTNVKIQTNLDHYSNDRYYVDPVTEETGIDPINDCLMIPILKFLDTLSNKKADSDDFMPTKFITLVCARKDIQYCNQIFSSLEFAQKIRSS